MSLKTALVTGVGVQTVVDDDYVPEHILVGTVDTDLPLTGFSYSIDGHVKSNIIGQALLQAFSKFQMKGLLGADVKVGQLLTIADGGVRKKFQAVFTNAGATTPNIYLNATRNSDGLCVLASTLTIEASSSYKFEKFSGLIFPVANLDSAEITWKEKKGKETKEWTNRLTGVELDALFATQNVTDADGRLIAQTVIDNSNGLKGVANPMSRVTLYTTAGGTMTVLVIKVGKF